MLIGYMRISKADGSQSTDLQRDALLAAGVADGQIYSDEISGAAAGRPGLDVCLKALRADDVLIVWRLDRLGRSLRHLTETVNLIAERGAGFRSLTEGFDTTTPAGRLFFHVMGALAEFERDLIRERVNAGLAAARARGRLGGRPPPPLENLLAAAAAMAEPSVSPREVAKRFGIGVSTLYRYVAPDGSQREPLKKLIAARRGSAPSCRRAAPPDGDAPGDDGP